MSEGDRLNETAVHSLTVDGAHETVFSPETQQTALLSVPDMHLSQRRKSKTCTCCQAAIQIFLLILVFIKQH